MSEQRQNLFTRDDTFVGVCQGISEDTGIPADLLRLAVVAGLYFAPVAAVAAYAAMGVVVFATHMLIRAPKPAKDAPALTTVDTATPAADERAEPLPLAA